MTTEQDSLPGDNECYNDLLNDNNDKTKTPHTEERGTQTILQLNPADLINQNNEDIISKTSFAVDDHPGTFSSDWDYKDRRQILEETRTFFNNFLVIERIYESDEKKNDEESCKSSTSSSKKKSGSTETNDTKTFEAEHELEKQDSYPGIRVHRPSFTVPAMYKVDIEVIKERIYPGRIWCQYILGGIVFIAMVLIFSLAFLGIEHMED